MLTKQKVKALLTEMESDCIERTTSVKEEKLGPAVCAFSNDFPNHKKPGYILLGVNDDGSIAGMKWTDAELQKIGGVKTNGNVLPQPSIVVSEVFQFTEGEVVVVEVKPSSYPPVRYDGRCWIRIGARKGRATPEEEKILTERRATHIKTFDLMPAHGTSIEDLNIYLFKSEYLPAAIDKETFTENGRTTEVQLGSLRFYDPVEKLPTNAGILFFGLRPKYFIPGDYIQYVKFDGPKMTDNLVFEKVFWGPLFTELKVIDEFLKVNIIKERPVQNGTFREDTLRNYPHWALRELTMNAIMHRNYESNAPIYIYEFSNRIEIVNPGGLYGDVNADNFPNASDYRNIVLAEAMKVSGHVNRFNYGILRSKEVLKENGNAEPVFDLSLITKFKVTVNVHPDWEEKTEQGVRDGVSGINTIIGNTLEGIKNEYLNSGNGGVNPENGGINPENGGIKTDEGANGGINLKTSEYEKVINAILNSEIKTKVTSEVRKKLERVLDLIARNSGLSSIEISKRLEIPSRTMEKYISTLRNSKLIYFKGALKSGGYFLTKSVHSNFKNFLDSE